MRAPPLLGMCWESLWRPARRRPWQITRCQQALVAGHRCLGCHGSEISTVCLGRWRQHRQAQRAFDQVMQRCRFSMRALRHGTWHPLRGSMPGAQLLHALRCHLGTGHRCPHPECHHAQPQHQNARDGAACQSVYRGKQHALHSRQGCTSTPPARTQISRQITRYRLCRKH